MVATWLTFTHCTPIVGSGGMERIAVFPLLYWLLVAGVSLLPKAGPGPLRPAASGAPRRPPRPAVTRRAGYGTWRAGRGKFVANRCSVFWMERSGVALTFAQQPIRVLGVDPGLTRCGLGVVDGAPGRALTLVRVGVVRTPADDGIAHRLLAIETEIEQWLDACQPNAVAVERVFSQSNVQTVMGTAQAGAVAIVCAARRGIPVALHTPTEVKAAVTGSGRADKDQVTSMVTRLLRLTERPKPADAADALALAICHIWRGGTASRLAAAAARVTTGGAGAGSAATRSPATRSPAPRSAGR
jgi:crossover junction endodeoxyribonuclease RuvC